MAVFIAIFMFVPWTFFVFSCVPMACGIKPEFMPIFLTFQSNVWSDASARAANSCFLLGYVVLSYILSCIIVTAVDGETRKVKKR